MDSASITKDLVLKVLSAAELDTTSHVVYHDPSNDSADLLTDTDEPITPGARVFKNRYVDTFIRYYHQLPSQSDKQYFTSYLLNELNPSEGIKREGVLI